MKIVLDWQGAKPAPADYAMLKAALVAAQSATPTVRAACDRLAPDPRDALEQMFAGLLPAADSAVALEHRFAAMPLEQVPPASDDMVDKS